MTQTNRVNNWKLKALFPLSPPNPAAKNPASMTGIFIKSAVLSSVLSENLNNSAVFFRDWQIGEKLYELYTVCLRSHMVTLKCQQTLGSVDICRVSRDNLLFYQKDGIMGNACLPDAAWGKIFGSPQVVVLHG